MSTIPDWLQALTLSEGPKSETAPVRASDIAYNWPAMFLAYSQGSELSDIAELFGCPCKTLEAVARDQKWAETSEAMKLQETTGEGLDAARLAKLAENREKNYDLANNLRTDLARKFQDLAKGELKVECVVKHKEGWDVAETAASPRDIKALAESARIMSEIGYRALGDLEEPRRNKQQSAPEKAVSINVNIPSAISGLGDIIEADS